MGKLTPVRTLLSFLPLAALAAFGAWFYWNHTEKDRVIAEQQRVITEIGKKLDRAWSNEIVADVRVTALRKDAAGKPMIDLTFTQYEPGTENPTFQRSLTLTGEEMYIDALVVKFDRKFVDTGDGLRGKSLLLFRRAFGDQQKPVDGVPLFPVQPGAQVLIPEKLQVDAVPSDFERKIWSQFWDLANDPDRAKAEGVAVAQGEAPHVKPVVGQVYKLTLKASGGLDMVPRLPAAVLDKPQQP
jgi:hypothetical protein